MVSDVNLQPYSKGTVDQRRMLGLVDVGGADMPGPLIDTIKVEDGASLVTKEDAEKGRLAEAFDAIDYSDQLDHLEGYFCQGTAVSTDESYVFMSPANGGHVECGVTGNGLESAGKPSSSSSGGASASLGADKAGSPAAAGVSALGDHNFMEGQVPPTGLLSPDNVLQRTVRRCKLDPSLKAPGFKI